MAVLNYSSEKYGLALLATNTVNGIEPCQLQQTAGHTPSPCEQYHCCS
jgi:hypothetical protein